MDKYNPKEIEQKWRKYWQDNKINQLDLDKVKKPFYNLMMFPYPSAEGLHVGNMYAFVHSDAYGRFMRLKGNDVFEPIGLDGFGIHSENYAIKIKQHIKEVSQRTEKHFYDQLHQIGNMYDWNRTVETYKPEYYKWTQWLFLQMYKKGLAYRAKSPVNWCPSCKTVLSDEQVISGRCERCSTPTEKRQMEQWFFRITDYVERLLKNLDWINWPDDVKIGQKNWLGKSQGATVKFSVILERANDSERSDRIPRSYRSAGAPLQDDNLLEVFTTRPDTLFGATYMVVCPEHEIIKKFAVNIKNFEKVKSYIGQAAKKSEMDRADVKKEKTGVRLEGVVAVNPVNKKVIPIFVADYVLAGYGTGAIMAVPAHDKRDFDFAIKYNLPIVSVIRSEDISKSIIVTITTKEGIKEELLKHTIEFTVGLSRNKREHIKITLRDNQIEEYINIVQKYLKEDAWVEIIGSKNIFILKDKVINDFLNQADEVFKMCRELEPLVNDYKNIWEMLGKNSFYEELVCYQGEGININSDFLNGLKTEDAKQKMIKWLEEKKSGCGSVNYKLRDWCVSRQRYWGPPIPMIHCETDGWLPVAEKDLPVLLPDLKDYLPDGSGKGPLNKVKDFVNTTCPKCGGPAKRETDVSDPFVDSAWYFLRYPCTEFDDRAIDKPRLAKWLPVNMYIGGKEHTVLHLLYSRFVNMVLYDLGYLKKEEPYSRFFAHGLLIREGAKISKSKGNIINPDEYIAKFGADSVRLYLMFLGDVRQGGDWRDSGMAGMYRFVKRVWHTAQKIFKLGSKTTTALSCLKVMHQTIKRVGDDLEKLKFNTAIAALMEYLNALQDYAEKQGAGRETVENLAKLISPFAPFIAEELWSQLGNGNSIFTENWPEYDKDLVKEEMIELVVQVNGKVRDRIEVRADIEENEAKKIALESDHIKKWLGGKTPEKIIFVKGRLVNIVTS